MWTDDVSRFLLAALVAGVGEPSGALWQGQVVAGRFRSDPYEVNLTEGPAGLGVVQTWFYCDRRLIAGRLPEPGDVLRIRNLEWEIVQRDEDDLGELGFRLIKYEDAPAAVLDGDANAAAVECPNGEIGRRPGRPSRRDEIVCAFAAVVEAGAIDLGEPLTQVFPAVRQRITGTTAPTSGLGDRTLRKTLAPLVEAQRNGQK